MVEVFKTNVQEEYQAEVIVAELYAYFPGYAINFDLADCDNILRVEAESIKHEKIIRLLHRHGVDCEILPG